jgi:hypothetical protein
MPKVILSGVEPVPELRQSQAEETTKSSIPYDDGRPPESIFNFVQRITRVACYKPHQYVRPKDGEDARKLLDLAA